MHHDPTFEKAAKREQRSCIGCINRTRTFGLTYCAKNRWSGINNERRCSEWDSGIKGISVRRG